MESKYTLEDPKLFKAYLDYPTLGPIYLYGFIQEENSNLFVDILVSVTNKLIIDSNTTGDYRMDSSGRTCFAGSFNIYPRGNPEYPHYDPTKFRTIYIRDIMWIFDIVLNLWSV